MKSNSLKNLLLYALMLIAIFVLSRRSTVTQKDGDSNESVASIIQQAAGVLAKYRVDTVTVYVPKKIVIRDSIVVEAAAEVMVFTNTIIDTVLIRLKDTISEEMRLFQGAQKGDSCTYAYQVGVHDNTLQYLSITSECATTIQEKEVTKYVTPKARLGIKGLVNANGDLGLGAIYFHKNLHFGLNYDITNMKPGIEAGYYFNVKK